MSELLSEWSCLCSGAASHVCARGCSGGAVRVAMFRRSCACGCSGGAVRVEFLHHRSWQGSTIVPRCGVPASQVVAGFHSFTERAVGLGQRTLPLWGRTLGAGLWGVGLDNPVARRGFSRVVVGVELHMCMWLFRWICVWSLACHEHDL